MGTAAFDRAWNSDTPKPAKPRTAFDAAWDDTGAPSAPAVSAPSFDNRMQTARPEQFDNAMTTPRPAATRETLGSVLGDLASGAHQGMSFGYGDELAAGTMALINKLSGKPGNYGALLKEAQDETKLRAERSPVLNVTGQVGGAVLGGGIAGATTRAVMGGPAVVAEAAPVARTVGSYLMQRGKNLAIGAGTGAVAGFGSGEGSALDRLRSAAYGGVAGGAFAGGMDLAGDVAQLTGVPKLVKNLMPRAATSESDAGKVAAKLGIASHDQVAMQDLMADIDRSGLSLDDYVARAQANPSLPLYDLGPSMNTKLGSPLAKLDPRGDPLVRRARGVQSIPSRGSAEVSQFVGQRAEQRPGDVRDAVRSALGVGPRQNAVDVETGLTAARNTEAKQNYDAIRNILIDDPDVLSLFDEPEFRALHQVVQDDARLRRQPAIAPIREQAALPLRDEGGRIRTDLSRVARQDLEAESHRLSQLNAEEEAYHGAVQDAGYRADYLELPETERLGHKGREDLPDADGMVDPERLLADNQIVKDYNRSLIVRRARARAVQRIDAELAGRQPAVDDSFNFGANADNGFDFYGDSDTPLKREPGAFNTQTLGTLDAMKRMADDIAAGTTSAKAIQRTQARAMGARLQDIRDRLDKLHPEYGAARGAYADASHEIEAAQLGGDFWKTSGDQLESAWRDLSPAAKADYRKTALAAIEDRLGSGMRPEQLLNAVNARKLRIIADSPDTYTAFEQSLRRSLQGGANDAMINGGSPTARIAAEQADLGAGGTQALSAATHAFTGNVRGVFSNVMQNSAVARLRGLGEQRVDALAPYLTASGEDLVSRLGRARTYRDALDARQRQSALSRLRVAGMLGGQVAKRSDR